MDINLIAEVPTINMLADFYLSKGKFARTKKDAPAWECMAKPRMLFIFQRILESGKLESEDRRKEIETIISTYFTNANS